MVPASGGCRRGVRLLQCLEWGSFFRLYTFRFKDGAAFTQDDFDGGMRRTVITDRLARLLFDADTGVTGRTFLMNYKTYTVCGVIEAPSKLMEHSYADMYAPYSIEKSLLGSNNEHAWEMGSLDVTIAAKDKEGIGRIRQAIDEHLQRYNTSHQGENLTLEIQGGPSTHWQSVLESAAGSEGSMGKAVRQLLLIVLVLLLVPALSLPAAWRAAWPRWASARPLGHGVLPC